MNPLWIVFASKPSIDSATDDRAAEIEAMYRRPDATPLPILPDAPSRFGRLRHGTGSAAARLRGVTELSRRDPVGMPGDRPTES
jgi:hypothetical protein